MPKRPPSPTLPTGLFRVDVGGEQGRPPSLLLSPAPSPFLCSGGPPWLLPLPSSLGLPPGALDPGGHSASVLTPSAVQAPQPCLQAPSPAHLPSLSGSASFLSPGVGRLRGASLEPPGTQPLPTLPTLHPHCAHALSPLLLPSAPSLQPLPPLLLLSCSLRTPALLPSPCSRPPPNVGSSVPPRTNSLFLFPCS